MRRQSYREQFRAKLHHGLTARSLAEEPLPYGGEQPELALPDGALLLPGRKSPKGLSAFAFFAGAGFLDLGFEVNGFEVAFANELNEEFVSGYRYSRSSLGLPTPAYGISQASVESFESTQQASRLREMTEDARRESIVGFIGGPPCPDFSVGGKNRGQHGDNGKLTATYFRLICDLKPDWFLFENVKGLWSTQRHRQFYDTNIAAVQAAGYCITHRLINALEYAAPQDRDRVICIGFSAKLAEALGLEPGGVIPESQFPWAKTIKYDIGKVKALPWPGTTPFGEPFRRNKTLPEELTVEHWFKKNSVQTHPNAKHQFQPRAGLAKFQTVQEGDVSRKSYKRLHRGRYSPTACYGNNEVHLHPTEPRRLSVSEVLAIQTLPRSFALPPTMTLSAMFKTVGNGVPFVVAKGLAGMLKSYLQERL
jgi:DNA (cytosine-5)-methyltransferase 1